VRSDRYGPFLPGFSTDTCCFALFRRGSAPFPQKCRLFQGSKRKTSYGTDSASGSRFVERILTVVATCRQQGRNVLAFLTDAIHAARTGATPPSLIPVHT
jgi:hypothetical protein